MVTCFYDHFSNWVATERKYYRMYAHVCDILFKTSIGKCLIFGRTLHLYNIYTSHQASGRHKYGYHLPFLALLRLQPSELIQIRLRFLSIVVVVNFGGKNDDCKTHTSAPGYIVDSNEFLRLYIDIRASCAHELICTSGI